MLKAKARAAATAAAAKKKAAAAAAAAQEAAAQQAQQAALGVASTTRSGRGWRPNVTQYWVSGASILAPGGSIQRIGYDQTLYEEAVRVVILGEQPAEKREMAGTIPRSQEEAEGRAEKGKEAQGMEGYKTNKEDLATILAHLDVPSAVASQALRAHRGDLAATLAELAEPPRTALARDV
ncbi:uncharacterized protein RHTO_03219 [Rhodotorula toruloides NP11]|uniref:Nascent polypeptide-associated complex subunit alpha-like UBA domain-containing protein n=1 Tax=Rhodotorula toruloides (strain NP11) TaxID=1130832 RepID=M7X5W7_RHOT1|nr:uncharacterized protein RHTO_03219 [Rhodotorula toruloides NP11]EMS25490.1 hypothetical protein RHTO_03219 [Rhodotorula toruloides NP11]